LKKDNISIVMGVLNGKVIFGSRLIFSDPQNPIQLPLEKKGVDLTKSDPNIRAYKYCEGGRAFIAKEYRGTPDLLRQMLVVAFGEAIRKGARYFFASSQVNNDSSSPSMLGLKQFAVPFVDEVPKGKVTCYPLFVDLSSPQLQTLIQSSKADEAKKINFSMSKL